MPLNSGSSILSVNAKTLNVGLHDAEYSHSRSLTGKCSFVMSEEEYP